MAEAFVYDHLRTPRGKGKAAGSLHEVKPVDLVVGLIDELRERNPSLDPAVIDDVGQAASAVASGSQTPEQAVQWLQKTLQG